MQGSVRSVSVTRRSQLIEGLMTIVPAAIVILFCVLVLRRKPGFFWNDDFQIYFLGGFRDIARAWESGEFPLLSPYSWIGGGLAAEYQYGIFSIFIHLCIIFVWKLRLTLPQTAAALSMIHLGILASGAFRLARQRRLTPDLSMIVAIVAALNGWIVCWGAITWFPALSSFAWLPWTWWGLTIAVNEKQGVERIVPAGIFIYLILTAGWPYSVLMMVIVTIWFGMKTWMSQPFRTIGSLARTVWSLVGAWVIGIGLAAPALLIFVEYVGSSIRGETGAVLQREWFVPLTALGGLVLPSFTVYWDTFETWQIHKSVELACGVVPIVALLVACFRGGKAFMRSIPWELGLLGILLLLATSPGIGNFKHGFRWLPLFHLVLVIVAAEGLTFLRALDTNSASRKLNSKILGALDRLRYNLGAWAFLTIFVVWVRALLVDLDPTRRSWFLGIDLLFLALIWLLVEHFASKRSVIRVWIPFIIVLLSFWATYLHVSGNSKVMTWNLRESIRSVAPLQADIRYLSLYERSDLFQPVSNPTSGYGTILRPGNTSMYAGVEFINGYSPIQFAPLARPFKSALWGFLPPEESKRILKMETGSQGLLQLMGVDGLVVARSLRSEMQSLTKQGWRKVASLREGAVFHRVGAPSPRIRSVSSVKIARSDRQALEWLVRRKNTAVPLILKDRSTKQKEVQFAAAQTSVLQETRTQVTATVGSSSSSAESLIVFSRPLYPGYRATFNGKPLRVKALNLFLPAVQLPPGANGQLVLQYRPMSLVIGSIVSGITVLGTVVAIVVRMFNRAKIS
jgi:hypothetical protein